MDAGDEYGAGHYPATGDLAVDAITSLHILGSFLYVGVDDSTNLGYKISLASPLTVQTAIVLPAGVTEAPIDILDDGTYVYFLLSGVLVDASILKYTTTPSLNTTITLTAINNVKSFTIDTNDDIWCVTNESPSKLIRVYDDGGYTFEITLLGS